MLQVKLIVIGLLLTICSFFIYSYFSLKQELAQKKLELVIAGAKLDEQNKAIEKLRIDVDAYNAQQPQIVEKVVDRYKTITVKDNSCESYMQAIYEAQSKFFNRKKAGK